MSSTMGRRAEHKQRTRLALQQVAVRMFEERGFDATTVRDIAAAAGVTERTFFRYFRSKEDLVLDEVLELLPLLQRHIAARPAGERPYTAVLSALMALADERGTALGVLFSGHPARFFAQPSRPADPVLFDFENGIAETLQERLEKEGGESDADLALRASVLARASVAAMRAALIAHAALPEGEKTPDSILDLLREAFAALRHGGA